MNKYHAKPTTIDNVKFDSRKEAQRYQELCLLQRAGEISHLELQPKFDMIVNGVRCGYYKADFLYFDKDGREHIEDAKGYATPVYKLKKRIIEALHSIRIEEV